MELTARGPTQTWPQPWSDRVFPTVLCHRPGVDMAEGTRGGRKGPGHSSGALTGFGGVDGKVPILKILGNIQIQDSGIFTLRRPTSKSKLLSRHQPGTDPCAVERQGCANSFAATSLWLSPRSMMRLGNKISGRKVVASLTIQGLSDRFRFRLEVPTVLIASAWERIRV